MDKCEDCGNIICNCADDVKFTTPPAIFALEEQIQNLKQQLEEYHSGYKGSCYCCEPVAVENNKLVELVSYYTTFIIKNDLEEEFDKFVSNRIENE